MKYITLQVYFIILLTQVSCKSQNQSVVKDDFQNDSKITLIDTNDYSGIYEAETTVIRDMKSLSKFYAQVNKMRKPGLPVPTIDFSKYTVLAICAGEQKPDTKMVASIADENENTLLINLRSQKNTESGDVTITVITHPFYLYQIPFTEKTVEFKHLQ
ncbi:MAG: hypothetical protein AAGD17_12810 [Bacteroidota bacterium]